MALSGTITGSCDNGHYTLTCEWSATQSISNNTSTVTARVYLAGNGYTTTSSYWSGGLTIGGTAKTFSNKSASINAKTLLIENTVTLTHASDGTLTTPINFNYSNGLTSSGTYTTKTGSGGTHITLNTIARASSISLSRSSATIGSDSVTVNISRASSNFTHKVQLFFGSYSTLLKEGVGTSHTFTPNIGLCSQIPNATSGTATIKVQTMNGSTWIGETSKTITLNVPSHIVPTVGIKVSDNNLLSGYAVATKSTFTVAAQNAAGSYSSTIKSYLLSGGGLSSTSTSATTKTLSAGTYTFSAKVTDSRGRTATATTTRTVYDYSSPSGSITSCKRVDSTGAAKNDGTYVSITFKYNITDVAGKAINAKKYAVYKKLKSATTWTTVKSATALSNYSGSLTVNCGSGFETTNSYDIKVDITDSYSTKSLTANTGTIACIMDFENNGIGIGKMWEQGKLDVNGDIYSSNTSASGKNLRMGVGSSDCFLTNTSTGKYIQLKDNGSLSYTGHIQLPYGSNFYINNSDGNSKKMLGVASNGNLDFGDTTGNVILCSKGTPSWYNGSTTTVLHHNNSDTYLNKGYNFIASKGSFYANNVGETSGQGFVSRRFYNNKQQTSTFITYATGGGAAGIIHRIDTDGIETGVVLQTWGSGGSGTFRPTTSGNLYLGSADYKFYAVYASNGTINTSDERYKTNIENIDIDECFEAVKNTPVYSYCMLNKDKNTMTDDEISKAIQEQGSAENSASIQMGVLAQDLLKYNIGKYVIKHDEWVDEETKEEKDQYFVNPYCLTSMTLAATQKEIQIREKEIKELKDEIKELKQRLNILENK